MKQRSYYIKFLLLWLLFATVIILLLFRLCLTYGKINVTIDYSGNVKEDLTVYHEDGTTWDTEKFILKKTRKGRHSYSYTIRYVDSVRSFRIDPDEAFSTAVIHAVSVQGLVQPVEIKDFDILEYHGMDLMQKPDSAILQRHAGNEDPYLIIPIDKTNRMVLKKWESSDIIVLILAGLFLLLVMWLGLKYQFLRRTLNRIGTKNFFLILSFSLIISSYWANYLLDFYPVQPNIEKRSHEKLPELNMLVNNTDSFFLRCNQWCYDKFRYRNLLIGSRSELYYKLFNESAIPQKVIIGEQDMFFPSFAWFLDDFRGRIVYPEKVLEEIYTIIRAKHDTLARYGIQFYIFVPPTKQTIYGDLMPEYYRIQQKRPSLLDQITNYLKQRNVPYFISLADSMNAIRQSEPEKLLFYNNDTHWNEYGAFKTYRIVMNYLHQADSNFQPPLNENQISTDTLYDIYGDLAECLILNHLNKRKIYRIFPFACDSVPYQEFREKNRRSPTYVYNNTDGYGNIVFYRDSYMVSWIQFFPRHFRRSVFIWDYQMDMNEIKRYNPDIVVLEIGELFLSHLLYPMKPLN